MDKRKIAIVGAGCVGCAFATHLVSAGHDVTLVARGHRLAQLQRNGGILNKKSKAAKETTKTNVTVSTVLDSSQPWDLVILTVLAHQLDEPLLRTLKACPETTQILLMFNTFAPLDSYTDALGKHRCIIGFPAVMAYFDIDDALVHTFVSFGQATIVSKSSHWRDIIAAAGVPTTDQPDMQSWLRTHAVGVIAWLASITTAAKRDAGVAWAEARTNVSAAREGFALLKKLGDRPTPWFLWFLFCAMPLSVMASLIWLATRSRTLRNNPTQQVDNWQKELVGLTGVMIELAPQKDDVRLVSEMRKKHS